MKSKATGSVIVGVIAAVGALVLAVCPAVAVEAAYPVGHAKRAFVTRVWSRVKGLFNASAAAAENVRLKREVAALALLRGDVERLEAENARLRRGLSLAAKAPEAWLAAGVLAVRGGAAGVREFLRVDRGALAGVKKGAVVAVPEGLVGRVVSVTAHTAEVASLTDPAVKVHVRVEGEGRVRGVLSGGTDDALVLRSLQGDLSGASSPVARARVLTSGLGGVFPPGLEIGTWIQFHTNANSVVTGEVLPAVEFSTLEEVFIRREK